MGLNFFTPFIKTKKSKQESQKFLSILILGFFLFFIIAMTIYNIISILLINKSINDIERQMNDPSFSSKVSLSLNREKEINQIKTEKAFLQLIDKSANNIDTVTKRLLDIISSNVTQNLYFKKIDINLNEINITGATTSKLEIAQFEYNIRNSNYFEDIYVDNIQQDEQNAEYNFNMKFRQKKFD